MRTLLATLLASLASMSLASTSRAESIGHAEFQIGEPRAALARVHLATTKAFRGSSAAPESEQLHDVAPELVAWGEALHAAVRKSALSLSGELVLPGIAFGKSP